MDVQTGRNNIGFLQINVAGREISHDLLMLKITAATKPTIICVQEPVMTRKGFCQLPKGYECFWSYNKTKSEGIWEVSGIERDSFNIEAGNSTTRPIIHENRQDNDGLIKKYSCEQESPNTGVVDKVGISRNTQVITEEYREKGCIDRKEVGSSKKKQKRSKDYRIGYNEETQGKGEVKKRRIENKEVVDREVEIEPVTIRYIGSRSTDTPSIQNWLSKNGRGSTKESGREDGINISAAGEVRKEDVESKKRRNVCSVYNIGEEGLFVEDVRNKKRRKKYGLCIYAKNKRMIDGQGKNRGRRIEPVGIRSERTQDTTRPPSAVQYMLEHKEQVSLKYLDCLQKRDKDRHCRKRKKGGRNIERMGDNKGKENKKKKEEEVCMGGVIKTGEETKKGDLGLEEVDLQDGEYGKKAEGVLKVVRRKRNRVRAVIIAPKDLKGYMVSQYSNQDCVVVRFECIKISVISLYCDIRVPIDLSLEGVVKETTEFRSVIICADTNAHCERWGATGIRQNRFRSYKRGEQICEYLDELDLMVCNNIPHLPTFVGDTGFSTYIDATFCSSWVGDRIKNWKVSKEQIESDHRCIVFDYKLSKDDSNRSTIDSNSHEIPWLRLTDKMMGKLVMGLPRMVRYQRRMGNKEDVNLFVQKHTTEIQEALGKIFKHSGKKKYSPCYWWNKEISILHKKMRTAKRRMDRYKYNNLVEEYNKSRRDFRTKVKEAKIIAWREFTSNISDPWNGLMKILQRKEVNKAKDRTLCTADGAYANDMMGTLCMLSDQFYPEPMRYTEEQLKIEEMVRNSLMDVEKGEDITLCEFRKALGEMKKVSAPGKDSITNAVLQVMVKECKFESQYMNMFNVCLKYGIFPDVWKEAKIVLIPKASDMLDSVKSMRPISLTSVFSKLLERIVLARILHYIELSGCLAISQHAYRKGGSTITALYEVNKFIQDAVYDRNVCVIVFLDISGAFDRTWHDGILFRLLQYGVPKYLVKWVKAFLMNRSAQFSAAGVQYDKALNQGCPQGGVLSPVLWNVFFNDMLTMKTKADQDFHLKIVGYADDAAVLCRAKSVKNASVILTNYLCRIKKWADANRVQFNQSKLRVLVCGKGSSLSPSSVYYNNILISEVTQYKYLGLTFDRKLSWRPHVNNLMDKLTKVTQMLRCAVREKWGVRMEIMRILYKAIFCPILLYGIAIWGWKASGKNMCMKFDRIMRKFCIMSTRCFRSTSNEMLFRLMKTSNFSCLLRQEVLRVALLQLNLFENQSDDVYSRNSMIERSKPLSMEHFFFLCKQGLNKESMNIVYDNLLHFHSVHPAEWVITRTCINDRVKAIWGSVYMMGWIVYTDASVSTYGAGCAIVVYHHGFCVKIQWYALSKCSIFTAETQAVLQAIKYITGIEKIRKEEIIEIRSDAQAVIRALDKTIVTDPALKEVKDELRKTAAKGINILLKWVPSHAGIEGNEIADNYAKQAVDSLVSRDTVLGKKDLKIEIRKMIRDQSRKEWEKYKGNVPKMFFPTVNEFESFSKSSPSVELCQLVTGHCRLNEFMCNKLAVVSSSACACGEGVETVFHYIMECMLYERIRQEVWNDFVPSFEYIRKDWKKVDEFIRKTRRFEYKSIGVS